MRSTAGHVAAVFPTRANAAVSSGTRCSRARPLLLEVRAEDASPAGVAGTGARRLWRSLRRPPRFVVNPSWLDRARAFKVMGPHLAKPRRLAAYALSLLAIAVTGNAVLGNSEKGGGETTCLYFTIHAIIYGSTVVLFRLRTYDYPYRFDESTRVPRDGLDGVATMPGPTLPFHFRSSH